MNEIGVTKNKIAVESKVRPATINDLVEGNSKRFEADTINNILDAVNRIAYDKGIKKQYSITDIIEYIPNKKETSD